MNFKDITHTYFIGIGGIGMSALARFFLAAGKQVAGFDRTPSALTDELMTEGIAIQFDDSVENIKPGFRNPEKRQQTLVVYTPAIPPESIILNWYRNNGFTLTKRSKVLGIITKNAHTIAVAGTHGKTTTSTMIAHLLHQSGIKCTAFLGGISKNYQSNLLLGNATDAGGKPIMVVEADEYDRSFLELFPHLAVITATDPDHLDIYHTHQAMIESYRQFAAQVDPAGLIIAQSKADTGSPPAPVKRYGQAPANDYHYNITHSAPDAYLYEFGYEGGKIENIKLALPGRHNVENSVAAIAVAKSMNLTDDQIRNALQTFKGIKRRFEFIIRHPQLTFIDDYAHHPDEIRAAVLSVREMFPGKKITGIFQPHLYSRTRDFAEPFAQSLSLLDFVFLLPVYPAREKPIEGVTSEIILSKLTVPGSLESFESLLAKIPALDSDVLITLGAGNIDTLVKPIESLLIQKLNANTSHEN